MTSPSAVELYYDPFDVEIDSDPYPVWKRMREEAPLYYNEKYNFYALSRYDDVVRELLKPLLRDWLDANLPRIVENAVQTEVERIARRHA